MQSGEARGSERYFALRGVKVADSQEGGKRKILPKNSNDSLQWNQELLLLRLAAKSDQRQHAQHQYKARPVEAGKRRA